MSFYSDELGPCAMPPHFFWGALHLDFKSAVKADVFKQNYSVFPRHWYIDATFHCPRCGNEFCFSAQEQRKWYEELNFYVDTKAKHCLSCRRELRAIKHRRQEYDQYISNALQSDDCTLKQRMIDAIDELCESGVELPEKIHENRRILARQVAK